ncbi:MAG: DUF4157 domain-containing protein [Sphingomonas sp.]|uniref:eCIS core domain-containing protein n=1 Tax=Sphingomonas sp. TaxID=28214 RepID=UPI00122235AD|nr:DUF4157 domain-containing protein [Sphingomonas sp.]THD35601.1 MAG: DUF4157 domain-containing protein [Sphingomonas sp.]
MFSRPVQRQAAGGSAAGSGAAPSGAPGITSAPRIAHSIGTTLPVHAATPDATGTTPPNRTGLPDDLKRGIEALSGVSMDAVRVHRDSHRPGQIQAEAFAQGTTIHLAPGRDHHLPHEAWHIVQQAQGRVRPTMRLGPGVPANNDAALEREADVMGRRALNMRATAADAPLTPATPGGTVLQPYLEEMADGNRQYRAGLAPPTHKVVGTTAAGEQIYTHQDVLNQRAAAAQQQKQQRKALRREIRNRAIPETRRRDFTVAAKASIAATPELVTREDTNLRRTTGDWGQRKAHLTDRGLVTAGNVKISAAGQMNQQSADKPRGNRVSAKGPVVGAKPDNSQGYGGEVIGIKTRKIERARQRGKPDAQHIRTRTTNDILAELDAAALSQGDRNAYKAMAKKDREHHVVVDAVAADDEDNYIPSRFLKYQGHDVHDSDSEADSDDDADADGDAPVAVAVAAKPRATSVVAASAALKPPSAERSNKSPKPQAPTGAAAPVAKLAVKPGASRSNNSSPPNPISAAALVKPPATSPSTIAAAPKPQSGAVPPVAKTKAAARPAQSTNAPPPKAAIGGAAAAKPPVTGQVKTAPPPAPKTAAPKADEWQTATNAKARSRQRRKDTQGNNGQGW